MLKITLGHDKELDGYTNTEAIAITFALAKLNNIAARGGTMSNRFGLQKTANNIKHLSNLDENRETSNIPYAKYNCKSIAC